jgi:hypothetical protein
VAIRPARTTNAARYTANTADDSGVVEGLLDSFIGQNLRERQAGMLDERRQRDSKSRWRRLGLIVK